MPEEPEDHSLEKLDRRVLVQRPLQGEVLPATLWTPPEVRWFRRPAFIVFGSLSVFSLACFFLSAFLQMRGVMSDIASRICLYASVVLLSVTVWSIALNFTRRRIPVVLASLVCLALIIAAYKV